MARPEKLTITEVVARCNISRAALFKKCSRAHKKKDSVIYINGTGWFSITKPGKSYILYLISGDGVPQSEIKKEVENNVRQLFTAVDSLVCEECSISINELKEKIFTT